MGGFACGTMTLAKSSLLSVIHYKGDFFVPYSGLGFETMAYM